LFGNLTQPDQMGFVFQNFVASQLLEKNANTSRGLNFWRTLDRAEVDFILNDNETVLPVEVKYSKLKNPEVTRSLRNFIREYSPKEAWVINLSLEAEIKIQNTVVKFIPYYKL
jgi:hypothetical protein